MTSGSKPTSRFLPTLTEVVQVADVVRVEQPVIGREELAASIASSVQQKLDSVMPEMVNRAMHEEAERAKEVLRRELEPLIRALVAEALTQSLPPTNPE